MKYFTHLFTWLFLVSVAASCQPLPGNIKSVPAKEFAEQFAATPGAQLLDVRTPDEFNSGHLAEALNHDYYSSDFEALLSSLDPQKPVFIYCRTGRRSLDAAKMLAKKGFTQIIDLKGGIVNWQSHGLAIVR